MNMVDEDFSSLLSFKDGEIVVDYASAILLHGYLNHRVDWYYIIKEKEQKDFEYRSYIDYSNALFAQLFDLIKNYSLANDKKTRVAVVNGLKLVCSQINLFCKGNNNAIVSEDAPAIELGDNLNILVDEYLDNDMHMDVYNRIIRPLEEEAKTFKRQEEEYCRLYKEATERDIESIVRTLPDEIKNASTKVIDIAEEKILNANSLYGSIYIYNAYQKLYSAISKGNSSEIRDAQKELIEQCRIVNECKVSPSSGDLRPLFSFARQSDLIDFIKNKYDHSRLQTEIKNIDMKARNERDKHVTQIREKCSKCIDSTIDLAKKLGILSESFNLDEICDYKNSYKTLKERLSNEVEGSLTGHLL